MPRTGRTRRVRLLRAWLLVAIGAWPAIALAAPAAGTALPPLGPEGQSAYAEFRAANAHKAFVIAPGGAWAWVADQASRDAALSAAAQECADATAERCVPYAVDGDTVFDARAWGRLWAPYPTREQAQRASIGTARGQRMIDLALRDPAGKPTRLSALHARVVVVHFWGSWCGPCRHELPQLRDAMRALGANSGVKLVLIQVREPVDAARAWLAAQGIDLPVYDSGARDERSASLTLADGSTVNDRRIAAVFPSTYVLDGQGIVLFAHAGAISGWRDYLPLLRDAARGSAR